MFAMVTPPVLFFAHALSNYSEVFNKINTFFQKKQGFFPIFSSLVVKRTGKHHIWGCAESGGGAGEVLPLGIGLTRRTDGSAFRNGGI